MSVASPSPASASCSSATRARTAAPSRCSAPSTTATPALSRPRSSPSGTGNGGDAVHPGPYTFANAVQATQFVTEAVEALMVLGCDVQAQ